MPFVHLMARRTAAVMAVALGVVLTVPVVAGAAFPGTDGVIAFVTTRNNAVAIDQVNPNGSGLGTSSGDLANTTGLTQGSVDAEPFYSPDGTEVVFSSNRTGRWAIYEIGQTDTDESTPAAEISQINGTESHDDYGPSFSDDGNSVVFNRDNLSIYSVFLPSGVSSACDLYDPPGGLAAASGDNGAASRIVFDPADPTKLVYVAGNNHIHLLSGVVVPTAAHPCPAEPSLTDVDLSATATGGTPLGASQADANPDWSPDGTKIIFDSTRAGGHSLWYFTNPTSGSPTVAALWPGLAGSTTSDTQPVFSPDGTHIAYTQPVVHNGTQVIDYEDTFGAPQSMETDLTLGAGSSANSQPDWQPLAPGPNLPEAPTVLLLPGAALTVGGGYWLMRRRRSLVTRPAHVGGAPR
jgi:Tol biopolymer transport system component